MIRKTLLTQDECAPDAAEYFSKEFQEITGISQYQFTQRAAKICDDGDYWEWKYKDFILCVDPTGPVLKQEVSEPIGTYRHGLPIAKDVKSVADEVWNLMPFMGKGEGLCDMVERVAQKVADLEAKLSQTRQEYEDELAKRVGSVHGILVNALRHLDQEQMQSLCKAIGERCRMEVMHRHDWAGLQGEALNYDVEDIPMLLREIDRLRNTIDVQIKPQKP